MGLRRGLRDAATESVDAALGRSHRLDPVLPRTGGPAGNARLTAWLGIVLLALLAAELVTLLDVGGLISWHLAIGVALIPPAVLKTATTGWRIVSYYVGRRPYREAGPPPIVLRVLGPLVVVTTLAVLGSGVALVLLGPERSHRVLFTLVGQHVDAVTVHQASFAGWAVGTGAHVLGRLWPAWQLIRPSTTRVPSRSGRLLALLVVLALAAACAGWVLAEPNGWLDG